MPLSEDADLEALLAADMAALEHIDTVSASTAAVITPSATFTTLPTLLSSDDGGVLREYLEQVRQSTLFADSIVAAVSDALGAVAGSAAALVPLTAEDVMRTITAAAIGASLDCGPSDGALALQLRLGSPARISAAEVAMAAVATSLVPQTPDRYSSSTTNVKDEIDIADLNCQPGAPHTHSTPAGGKMFLGMSFLAPSPHSAASNALLPHIESQQQLLAPPLPPPTTSTNTTFNPSSSFFCLSPMAPCDDETNTNARLLTPCDDDDTTLSPVMDTTAMALPLPPPNFPDWFLQEQRHARVEEERLANEILQLEREAASARSVRQAAQRVAEEAALVRQIATATLRLQSTARGFITRRRVHLYERLAARTAARKSAEVEAAKEAMRETERLAAEAAESERQRVILLLAAEREAEECAAAEQRRKDIEAAEIAAAIELQMREQAAVEAAAVALAAEAATAEMLRVAQVEAAAVLERERIEVAAALERERIEVAAALECKRVAAEVALERERAEEAAALELQRVEAEKALKRELMMKEAALELERLAAVAEVERKHAERAAEEAVIAEAARVLAVEVERVRVKEAAFAAHEAAIASAASFALVAEDILSKSVRTALHKRQRIALNFGTEGRGASALLALQSVWRGGSVRCGKFGSRVTRALTAWRQKRAVASTRIQSLWRGARLRSAITAAIERAEYGDTNLDDFAAVDVDDFLAGALLGLDELSPIKSKPLASSSSSLPLSAPLVLVSPLAQANPVTTPTQLLSDPLINTPQLPFIVTAAKSTADITLPSPLPLVRESIAVHAVKQSSVATTTSEEDWGVSNPAVIALFKKRKARMMGGGRISTIGQSGPFVSTVQASHHHASSSSSFQVTGQRVSSSSSFVGRVRSAVRGSGNGEITAEAISASMQQHHIHPYHTTAQDNLPDFIRPAIRTTTTSSSSSAFDSLHISSSNKDLSRNKGDRDGKENGGNVSSTVARLRSAIGW